MIAASHSFLACLEPLAFAFLSSFPFSSVANTHMALALLIQRTPARAARPYRRCPCSRNVHHNLSFEY